MKFVLFFLLITTFIFSQKKASKSFEFSGDEIEINTDGLDNITIENSNDNRLEIFLLDVNLTSHDIHINQEKNVLKLNFENEFILENDNIFRKFITKRLERASVLVKIPKEKTISVFGKTVGITSKNYQGNLNLYIEKGNIYLNEIQRNIQIKLFAGNIKATTKQHNFDVISNKGNIVVDEKKYKKKYKSVENQPYNFVLTSINANVMLTTKKTQ